MPITIQKACGDARDWLLDHLFLTHRLSTYVGMVIGAVRDQQSFILADGVKRLGRSDPPDADTLYKIGSITKTFTATQLAIHADRGHVEIPDLPPAPQSGGTTLQALLDKFFPGEFSLPKLRKQITVLDLATHYAGLAKFPRITIETEAPKTTKTVAPPRIADLFVAAQTMAPVYAPNQWFYSNMGFALLGHLLARFGHSGTVGPHVWAHDIRDRVTKPLGMPSTGTDVTLGDQKDWINRAAPGYESVKPASDDPPFETSDFGNLWAHGKYRGDDPEQVDTPGGGLWSSATDSVKWLRYNLGVLAHPPDDLEKARRRLHVARRETQTDEGAVKGYIGLGWEHAALEGKLDRRLGAAVEDPNASPTVIWKGGDLLTGYHSYLAFVREAKVGAFVLCNFDITHANKVELVKKVIRALLA